MFRHSWILTLALFAGCASAPPPPAHAQGTSPLAPFDVDLPSDNTRHQLAVSLQKRGFLAADAPEGTQLGGAIRAFQKSEGLNQTGWPDDATLRALGIDPATKDRSLDTSTPLQGYGSSAGASH
jgi:peptidoglycan hydrolase-like protein with peptidoglycan-binding domain